MYKTRVLAGPVLVLLLAANAAVADTNHVCSLRINFENRTQGPMGGVFKLGINLAESKSRLGNAPFEPILSKKTVWSGNLKVGAGAVRTLNVRFRHPCRDLRLFRLHTCWKKAGTSGGPICATQEPTGSPQGGSWRVAYHLEVGTAPGDPVRMVTTVATNPLGNN